VPLVTQSGQAVGIVAVGQGADPGTCVSDYVGDILGRPALRKQPDGLLVRAGDWIVFCEIRCLEVIKGLVGLDNYSFWHTFSIQQDFV
jgi:hypothetical protein